MALSCGAKCLKYIVFLFNSIIFIGGAILSAFGIYLIVKVKEMASSHSEAMALPAFILTLGLLIFIIGFLGCAGAIMENVCMLKTFAVVIGILLLMEIVGAILLFVYRSKVKEFVSVAIKSTIERIKIHKVKTDAEAMDILQSKLKCCGAESSTDWDSQIPLSCCEGNVSSCEQNSAFKQGCAVAFYDSVKDSWLYMTIAIVVICILQLGAIISACVLQSKIQSYENV